ncbi:IS3 family transposase [Jinshanibacter sp. LJY008]|uniref:IS3 family transposase n=1 Tax=Limnobaculum eriocheiris TaxID=2897391 RepID=A0A9X1MYY9_9GAMM|nr:IS3 family transposase [Limnobaculum eriocheiris]MCD1127499.1 IS3 family transposase [Limnobaculum eriocheiris]
MKKIRFTESQILRVLKEVEGGRHVKDVCRENGVSEASYYNWKSKYGGMESSDIKRMKELEEENRRLKQMYASLSLDHEILKDVVGKKTLTVPEKRELVRYVMTEHQTSERRGCRMIGISRSLLHYRPNTERDIPVIEALQNLADHYPAYGFGLMFNKLRQAGHSWNEKSVYRIYRLLKLNLRRKGKKRLPNRHLRPLVVPVNMNHCWSIDFMSDALMDGRRFRLFNVVDDFNREALAVEVDLNIPAHRVVRVLERLSAERGYPAFIRSDNGPELTAAALSEWAEQHGVILDFIQPGKPMQNGFIERFNKTLRTEILDMYLFRTLSEVRELTENWRTEYNEERPHSSLGNIPPVIYARQKLAGDSNLRWY